MNERHRHRYEINPKYVAQLEESGLKFVGTDEEETRMEIVELSSHPYYVGVQYHPEYLSRPLKPSPPFMGLILASAGKLKSYLNRGCRLSPREMSENSSGELLCIFFLSRKLSNSHLLCAAQLPQFQSIQLTKCLVLFKQMMMKHCQ